jgi:hypothetical protein
MPIKQAPTSDYQKTFGFKQRMRIGAALADQLPKRMGARECAKLIGVSTQMLRRIECEALFKVRMRMIEHHQDLVANL